MVYKEYAPMEADSINSLLPPMVAAISSLSLQTFNLIHCYGFLHTILSSDNGFGQRTPKYQRAHSRRVTIQTIYCFP